MNKRQRKKNISRALKNIDKGLYNKEDIEVLKTYGREKFKEVYGMPPELLEVDIVQTVEDIAKALSEVFSSILWSAGEAFEAIGQAFKEISNNHEEDEE